MTVGLVMAVPLTRASFAEQNATSARASAALDETDADARHEVHIAPLELRYAARPSAARFSDADLAVSITPPAGWIQTPASALNPVSDPPEPVQEAARFQVRLADSELYAAPIPVTSGLVADALAVISIGVAREGSDVLLMERGVRGTREVASVSGFTVVEDEATYEGLHVLTRYLLSRESDRVLVVRASAAESAWSDFEKTLRDSIATFSGDPKGTSAPAPPPPAPPPAPAPTPAAPDPTVAIRGAILQRAATLLGLRYVWGGNSTVNGMDCSAYVSWVWTTARYSTDSIWNVSFPIGKADLLPGDALNLTTGRDPRHLGHIRIFEAWANAEHSAMWVYEETPPRTVHRVVAYDDRYQPIRLAGLSGEGEARLIPATPAPEPTATRRPTTTRPTVRPTPRPTARPSGSFRPIPRPTLAPPAPTDPRVAPKPSAPPPIDLRRDG